MKTLHNLRFEKVSKKREQWGKLALYGSIAAGLVVAGAKFPVLGDFTSFAIASAFASPLALYAARVSRYFLNVRMCIPKYIRTGDGGDNYYSVITEKYWNPFWDAPIDHFRLPIKAHETIIDAGGEHKGTVYSGRRPLCDIAKNEWQCYPFPRKKKVGAQAGKRLSELNDKRPYLTETEYQEREGLLLFRRHGAVFED